MSEAVIAHALPEHSQRRAICIAVDDFGLHAGINQAALQLAEMGRVHAIGCMVGGAAWPVEAALLRRLDSHQLDLGLHLDLTESPLLPRTAKPLSRWLRDSFARRLDPSAVRAEIKAQLDAFEHAIGRGPMYIDGHQHVHQLPIVRSELLAELHHRYGGFKPWLRSTRRGREPLAVAHRGWRDRIKPWVIERLGQRGLACLARRWGHPQNRRLLGVYDFQGGAPRYSRLLADWFFAADNGDLLMSHPSLSHHDGDPIIDARLAEFLVLSGDVMESQRRAAGIELRPMSKMLGGNAP